MISVNHAAAEIVSKTLSH